MRLGPEHRTAFRAILAFRVGGVNPLFIFRARPGIVGNSDATDEQRQGTTTPDRNLIEWSTDPVHTSPRVVRP